MKFYLLVAFILISAGASSGRTPKTVSKQLRKEILLAKGFKEMEVLSTKSKVQFYFLSPGPCSCEVDSTFECVDDLEKSLEVSRKTRAEWAKVECSPNAGCVLGRTMIFVKCP